MNRAALHGLWTHNNRYRAVTAKGGLHSVDSLVLLRDSLGPAVGVSTLEPAHAAPLRALGQAGYNASFDQQFPGAGDLVRQSGGVFVVAGGAAAMPFNGVFNDVDFFVVSAREPDPCWLWQQLGDFSRRLLQLVSQRAPKGAAIVQTLTPGLYTVSVRLDGRGIAKYQVILRQFRHVSALLHGFDVDAACVAFDGTTTWLTKLGARAQLTGEILVNPQYRSHTYEVRLAKYFVRGYALVFVDMVPFSVLRNGLGNANVVYLWTTKMCLDRVVSEYRAVGAYEVTNPRVLSDYEIRVYGETDLVATNARRVTRSARFVLARTGGNAIDFADPAVFSADKPGLREILPRAEFVRHNQRAQRPRGVRRGRDRVRCKCLAGHAPNESRRPRPARRLPAPWVLAELPRRSAAETARGGRNSGELRAKRLAAVRRKSRLANQLVDNRRPVPAVHSVAPTHRDV